METFLSVMLLKCANNKAKELCLNANAPMVLLLHQRVTFSLPPLQEFAPLSNVWPSNYLFKGGGGGGFIVSMYM